MKNIPKIITIGLALILLLAYSGVASKVSIDDKGNLVGNFGNNTTTTLYYFSNDGPNMISTCYGNCSEIWNPFYAKDISVEGDLRKNDFDTIIRQDGKKQISYKNWPLYNYTKAGKPEMGELWSVVKPKDSPFKLAS